MSDSDETEKPISGSKKRPITGRTTEVMKKIRIQAHECGEPCGCKRLKCFEAVSSDERKHLLDYFNSLQTHDAQNLYLCGLITAMCVKQRRPVNIEAPGTRHDASYAYRVRVKKEEEFKDVPVCANAFMSMHGIGRGKLNYLKKSLITTGEAPKDKRGKSSGNHRRLHEDTLKAIKAHIGSFKTRSSHYAFKYSRRQYLPEDLNIKKMYAMFKEAHEILNASYETYRNIFNTQFNISFGYPRMDTCSFCDENRVKIAACNNEAELRKIKLEDLLHKKKAEVFYDRKRITRKTAIRDSSLVAIAMDYQKNVSLPNITTNDVYYKRQLSMNSFNIHNLADKKTYFYAYPETHARKGSDEVCTFLFDFLTNRGPQTMRHLHIFCDSCGGQNKNYNVFKAIHYIVHDVRLVDSITITFPVRGHSYLENDKNMGLINLKTRMVTDKWMIEHVMHALASFVVVRS